MVTRKEALKAVDLGEWVAEKETGQLCSYFWDTAVLYGIRNDKKDIIYGPTGAGKSALFFRTDELIHEIFGNQAFSIRCAAATQSPPFQKFDEAEIPPSEQNYEGAWLFFYATQIVEHLTISKLSDVDLIEVALLLRSAGLLRKDLFSWRDLVPNFWKLLKTAAAVYDPERATIVFGERQRGSATKINALQLLRRLNAHLQREGKIAVLLFDRLDAAFTPGSKQEAAGIRGLFRAYQDLACECPNIRTKIFMRTDLWQAITRNEAFREGAQLNARAEHIVWDRDSLLSVVVARLSRSEPVCTYAGFEKDRMRTTPELQRRFFYTLVPEFHSNGRPTFDWAVEALRDGHGIVSPRDIIHLFVEALDQSKRFAEANAVVDLQEKTLVNQQMLERALIRVSNDKFQYTLLAEQPEMTKYVEELMGKTSKWLVKDLASSWNLDEVQTLQRASELVSLGFFLKRKSKEHPFWIADVYHPVMGVGTRI